MSGSMRLWQRSHVGTEWRVGKVGTPMLELEMGQDFSLKARLLSPGGQQATVQIMDTRTAA